MPRRDGTGPMGQGPLTGGGRGVCGTSRGAGIGMGVIGLGLGLGYGCRRIARRFRQNDVYKDLNTNDKDLLQLQKQRLQQRLDQIEQELSNLS